MLCTQRELFDRYLANELGEAETEKYPLNYEHDCPR